MSDSEYEWETEYRDAAEVMQRLALDAEPAKVEMVGRQVAFKYAVPNEDDSGEIDTTPESSVGQAIQVLVLSGVAFLLANWSWGVTFILPNNTGLSPATAELIREFGIPFFNLVIDVASGLFFCGGVLLTVVSLGLVLENVRK